MSHSSLTEIVPLSIYLDIEADFLSSYSYSYFTLGCLIHLLYVLQIVISILSV